MLTGLDIIYLYISIIIICILLKAFHIKTSDIIKGFSKLIFSIFTHYHKRSFHTKAVK